MSYHDTPERPLGWVAHAAAAVILVHVLVASLEVIGNVIRSDNEEAQAWMRSSAKFISFPEAVRRFLIQDKRSVICSGTHGKTTMTSWMAFLFQQLVLCRYKKRTRHHYVIHPLSPMLI